MKSEELESVSSVATTSEPVAAEDGGTLSEILVVHAKRANCLKMPVISSLVNSHENHEK